jgi:hypothetical protein
MGETDLHRQRMVELIEALKACYLPEPNIYAQRELADVV